MSPENDSSQDTLEDNTAKSTSTGSEPEGKTDDLTAEVASTRPGKDFWVVVWSHLSPALLNLVPLVYYFSRSWDLEHYQFFPIAMLVFVFLLSHRMEWGVLRDSRWIPYVCSAFLSLSVACFVVSSFQYNHYLPTVGVFCSLGSLLFCLRDRETGESLLPTWFLLLPLIRIPLNFDITLISELQFFSSAFASNCLDFLGIPNFTPGTVIHIPEQGTETGVKKFDVERACSGVQSLFTLIFCTLAVSVFFRRSFVSGLLLVLSGIFWSIVMNGVRIVICVAFYYWFDLDVYSGLQHEVLGYLVLIAAILLVISTDAVFSFLLGPIELAAESRNLFALVWNRLVAGRRVFTHRREVVELSESAIKRNRSILLGLLGMVNVVALVLLYLSLSADQVTTARKIGELGLVSTDVPASFQGRAKEGDPDLLGDSPAESGKSWVMAGGSFENITRNANSTYGPYSSSWTYLERPSNQTIQVSLDYTFLGWHELKICYKGPGWNVERVVVPDDHWKSVELYLSKNNGETGYCIFSIFDYRGEPVEPLSDNLGFFLLRLKNRIARELSTTQTFQLQCFIQTFDEIPKEKIESVRELHAQLREEVRKMVLDRLTP